MSYSDALVPFAEVCRILKISLTTGYRLKHDEEFPVEVVTIGRKLSCRRTDLDSFLRVKEA